MIYMNNDHKHVQRRPKNLRTYKYITGFLTDFDLPMFLNIYSHILIFRA